MFLEWVPVLFVSRAQDTCRWYTVTLFNWSKKCSNSQTKACKRFILSKSCSCQCFIRKKMHPTHSSGLKDTHKDFWWETLNLNNIMFVYKEKNSTTTNCLLLTHLSQNVTHNLKSGAAQSWKKKKSKPMMIPLSCLYGLNITINIL